MSRDPNNRQRDGKNLASKLFFKRGYENRARDTSELRDWTFMNYGYASDDGDLVDLSDEDEWNRYPIQLYHHLFSRLEAKDTDILDIGSGRGGGAAYMAKTFHPKSVTGVDLSLEAVKLSRSLHGQSKTLGYMQGDAENLPFDDEQFDIVTSVEASHCFASMTRFLKSVTRVLKPEGNLVFTDFRTREGFDDLHAELEDAPLTLLSVEEITESVVLALQRDHERKTKFRDEYLKDDVRDTFAYFAALKGSSTYEAFVTRKCLYKTFHMKRSHDSS